jgi:hypothetical protein
MSYLQDKLINGYYTPYYRLENLQNNLKKSLYRNALQKGAPFDEETFTLLQNYKNELNEIRKENLGINLYASLFAIAIYHTYTIYNKKTLLSEMGPYAFKHLNRLGLIGFAAGISVGYLFGRNIKTSFKYLKAKFYHDRVLRHVLEERKMIK